MSVTSFNAFIYSCAHMDVYLQCICADMHKYMHLQTACTALQDLLLAVKIVHFLLRLAWKRKFLKSKARKKGLRRNRRQDEGDREGEVPLGNYKCVTLCVCVCVSVCLLLSVCQILFSSHIHLSVCHFPFSVSSVNPTGHLSRLFHHVSTRTHMHTDARTHLCNSNKVSFGNNTQT